MGELADSPADIGRRITEARTAAGIDVTDLANGLAVPVETIRKWEDGTHSPRGHRLSRLAGMLGVGLTWLISGHGAEPVERDRAISDLLAAVAAARSQAVASFDDLEARIAALDT